ncbi:heparinase II/III-family protein, partial [Pricia sp.]|uniref:heparinase II/III family protein n=1 Tax=Pricia sp. TaxID=2268138 RepID=UPI0035934F67
YRKFIGERYELFVDVGNVGPTYQPGHAHADTFSFELYCDGQPTIVDTGISTYEKNELRQEQRGTAAHNTVIVDNRDQTQVWGGFRVAKRAKIGNLKEDANEIKATHNGYKNLGILHTRTVKAQHTNIQIIDELTKGKTDEQKAFFHLHPMVGATEINISQKSLTLIEKNIRISFDGNFLKMEKEEYRYASGFNRTEIGERLVVSFYSHLQTQIFFL